MRASVFIATSVDGYIARKNGDLDWLPAGGAVSDTVENGYTEFMAGVDVCVMGRQTFEKSLDPRSVAVRAVHRSAGR